MNNVNNGLEYAPLSVEVWEDNYKGPKDITRKDTWDRMAKFCSLVEKEVIRDSVEKDFRNVIYNDKFVPAGRILANLGINTRNATTLFNCFVHNPGDIGLKDCDSIDGIYDMLKAQAKTLKSEGGYGINGSWIRPAGSYVKGIGSRTPGVLKFMELWDKSSEVITQGSTKILGKKRPDEKNKIRKGAQMLVLNVWHPEILDFITAKHTEGRLEKFNMSVGITEGFMSAVIEDKNWDLKYPNTEVKKYKTEWFGDIQDWEEKGYPVIVYHTVKAREIWDLIMSSTYERAEPGVLFLDLANKLNPGYWYEKIMTTNPCISGDTLIAVADGRNAVSIKQLTEEGKDVPVYSVDKKTGEISIKMGRNPRITGQNKKLLRITLDDGTHYDVTPNHKMILKSGEEIFAEDLKSGDSLMPFSKFAGKIGDNKYYYKVSSNGKKFVPPVSEHRLISKFSDPNTWSNKKKTEKKQKWGRGGLVVHHKNFDAFDNSPDNLEVMTWKAHQAYHAGLISTGENNGRFLGNSSEEIYDFALSLTKRLGRKFSNKEWYKLCEENSLPKTFSKMHTEILGKTPTSLATKCAIELGLQNKSTRSLKRLEKANKTNKSEHLYIDENDCIKILKKCSGCKKEFSSPVYKNREFCSYGCYKQNGMSKKYKKIVEENKNNQAKIWSSLFYSLGKKPKKNEWIKECKKNNIPFRLAGSKYGFQTYKDVADAGKLYNHKIVSVMELEGEHAVYNITVDDNHSYGIVTPKYNKKADINEFFGLIVGNCGEVVMSTGACNLGSINLVTLIKLDKNQNPYFDFEDFSNTIPVAIRFLDNINDISEMPLPEYKKAVQEKRRIGVGVMGLGSIHIMLGIKYGSQKSMELTKKIFKLKSEAEILASAKLGKEKGSYKLFDKEKYFSSYWWKHLNISPEVKKEIENIGEMRNSHQSMNAPTGNTGIYAKNVSGGIEPVFGKGFFRWSIIPESRRRGLIEDGFIFPDISKNEWFETEHVKFSTRGKEQILKGTFEDRNYEIDKNRGLVVETFLEDYGFKFLRNILGKTEEDMSNSTIYATSQELTVDEHINVLKIAAEYTNMSVSKTVNVPNDYPYEDFKNIYLNAWKNNIKGITTYREGTRTVVLETKKSNKDNPKGSFTNNNAIKRPEVLDCEIFHMQVKGEKWDFFVGLLDDRPYEVFAGRSEHVSLPKNRKTGVIKKNGTYNLYTGTGENELVIKDLATVFENTTESAFTRTISLALRHGVPVQYVCEQLEKGASKDNDMFSLSKGLQRVLKKYIKDGTKINKKTCLKCSAEALVYQEGCTTCLSCGYSKCG